MYFPSLLNAQVVTADFLPIKQSNAIYNILVNIVSECLTVFIFRFHNFDLLFLLVNIPKSNRTNMMQMKMKSVTTDKIILYTYQSCELVIKFSLILGCQQAPVSIDM